MRKSLIAGACGLMAGWTVAGSAAVASALPAPAPDSRPRLIVLTDIGNEPDDSQSMVRLLVNANDLDIEGLVATTSRHLPKGTNRNLIEERVAGYRAVHANLRVHDPRYPAPELLARRIRSGSPVFGMAGVGKGKDTEASRLIIAAVDRPDPRPVWVAVWGGAADLAQALWTVRATRSPQQLERFVARLRVYSISDQDDAGPWARAYFPKLFWIASVHAFTNYQHATWTGISGRMDGADFKPVSPDWLDENIRAKGPLGALYPRPAYIMEGDTPSFLYLIPNGLGSSERPDWGSWGGRYGQLSSEIGLWANTSDSVRGIDDKSYTTAQASVWRWRWAYQNDFAARMLWSVTPGYRQANHAPAPRLNGQGGLEPIEIAGCPGAPIALSAAGSTDPDGDGLSYRWFWYREASGLFAPNLKLSSETGEQTSVTVEDTVRTDQFTPQPVYKLHVILEATDSGKPQLTRYRRAIISVPGAGFDEKRACAVTPIGPVH